MVRSPFVLVFALAAGACASTPPSVAPAAGVSAMAASDLWIRDVTVISPERSAPLAHANVLVRDAHIVSVGTDAPPPGARTIDGAGRWLVPGLIDGHTHLAEVPGVPREQYAALGPAIGAYFEQLPRSYLYFGFTTVVDLNVLERPRLEAMRAAPVHPRVLDCGPAIVEANGYPMAYVPSPLRFEIFPNFLYDERQKADIPAKYVPAEHTPTADVERVVASGGVCVKAFYESGFGAQEGKLPLPAPETMRAIAEATHRHHLPLLVHANSLSAHRAALEAGADVTAHGMWNWDADDDQTELPQAARSVLDAEVHAKMEMMPTSRVISGLGDLFAPEFLDDPQLANVLPAPLLAWYRTDAGHWFAREIAKGFPPSAPVDHIRAVYRKIEDHGLRAARYFVDHGGRLVFGSDTPSGPLFTNPPGYDGYLEMRALERAGIKPSEILAAATIRGAELFGVASEYGTITPGKRANLLLLRADPLASTAAFDTLETVFVDGRPLARAELRAPR
ncbi:MAG TPA: amidohydrolase family protein [Polyangiaceae bacterium]|jgi:imidazolonepropionase-like amidohydrolase